MNKSVDARDAAEGGHDGKDKPKHARAAFGLHLDLLMDSMEETRFRKKHTDLVEKLAGESHFTAVEIDSLLLLYYKMSKENVTSTKINQGMVTKEQFRDFLHSALDMTDDSLMDRIFLSLDRMPGKTITMETYIHSLSLFLRGTLEEKINHCFNVYSMGNGVLGKDTMFYLLKNSLVSFSGEDEAEESVKDMIEVITKKLDIDRDGRISFQDYKQTVLKNPMLLEVFGQCLPGRTATYTFLATFTSNTFFKM